MAKLAIFTQKKSRENKGTHDLRLHPDKLRARACPRLHIQKPIEGHASFLLDAPEETKVTCTCLGSSEFSTVQRNNTIRHVSSCHITSNSSSVDTGTNQERVFLERKKGKEKQWSTDCSNGDACAGAPAGVVLQPPHVHARVLQARTPENGRKNKLQSHLRWTER